MKYKYTRKVSNNGTITNGSEINRAIQSFSGKEIDIIVRPKSKQRTSEQNKLYWVYCTMIGNEIGYTKAEMHEILKYKFLTYEDVIEKTGEIITCCKSTSELEIPEFISLLEEIIRWSAEELGVVLPAPGEQTMIEL